MNKLVVATAFERLLEAMEGYLFVFYVIYVLRKYPYEVFLADFNSKVNVTTIFTMLGTPDSLKVVIARYIR